MDEDRRLVEEVLARRDGAFARLVRRHERLVWHVVGRMVSDPDDTRDLCQEVFLRVHQRLPQFRFEAALSTWIGRIAFSLAARHLRRKRLPLLSVPDAEGGADDEIPVLERVADAVDVEAEAIQKQEVEQLEAAIERLAPVERMLVTLYYTDELAIPEISTMTGLPRGTIKSHLFRARRRLRAALENDPEAPR